MTGRNDMANKTKHTNIANTRSYTGIDYINRSLVLAVVLLGCLLASSAYAENQSGQYKEYEVKAAFILNFLKFVDWPEARMAHDGNQITIGIIGEDPFGSAADIFKDKTVEGRTVVVKRFDGIRQLKAMAEKDKNEKLEALGNCHLLFICPSEQKPVREIIDVVGKHNVLTVGDTDGFIESGGNINFFIEDNKIRFDINLAAAEKAGLKIRAQLLRLAKNVIKNAAASSQPQKN